MYKVLKDLSLTRHRVESMGKVKTFLDSIERNSKDTKNSYHLGLGHFQNYLGHYSERYPSITIETILQHLAKNEIDVYELLDGFVSYLLRMPLETRFSITTIMLCLSAVRLYLGYYDIDVIPSKFKRRVKMPRLLREDEEPIDATDIRKILLACNNRRLKTIILVLASSAMRAREALAIRLRDIDFTVSPTKIHVRKEFCKTRVSRDIYISDEATSYLNQWIDWKYRDKGKGNEEWTKKKVPNDLVFGVYSTSGKPSPYNIYIKILGEFEKLLTIAGMDERKETVKRRRKITLHSMRRHAKSVISNQVNQDYSELILGHAKSPYYTLKESERREIYATKVMRYLTFLDYSALE